MTPESALACLAATFAVVLGALILWRERGHFAYGVFALGMSVLAARELLGALAIDAVSESEALSWHRFRLLAEAFVPGLWILFSLTYARGNAEAHRRRWRLGIAAAFAVPIAIVIARWDALLLSEAPFSLPGGLVPIGSPGLVLHVVFLLSSVVVLINLEATLRASSGSVRWQIKFFLLAIGVLFGVELFLHSQVLLYSWIQTTFFPLGSGALLLASGLVVVALARRRTGSLEIYPSESLIFNSLTLLVVGIYLLVVAGLVDVIHGLEGAHRAPLVAFFVLVAFIGLATLLLSGELEQRVRRFISNHLQRPSYDYRQVWDAFTRQTSSVFEIAPLCAAIAKMASETFGCSVATIWLVKPGEKKLSLGGSTAISRERAREIFGGANDGRSLRRVIASSDPVDLAEHKMTKAAKELFRQMEARYAVALMDASEERIGYLTLNERITKHPFSVEDFSLLKTFGVQAAATVANRRLTQELQRAREMEAFQTLSTFFVHDLKNLASRLSLAMQNLPAHFDKPAFRKDLLETTTKSVRKIESMTSRLSSITKGMELHPMDCDLNGLVRDTLASFGGATMARLEDQLDELPDVKLDREKMQKVLTNLILNAQDATGETGQVTVRTYQESGWVLVSVQDDGCGMSEEFMANSLFKPFQTTKKQGLGIGLFHSKKIVEAHGGRLEVESERDEGSTFRILLPAGATDRHAR